MSLMCFRALRGIRQTVALICDAKQTTGEENSGPVETRLTKQAVTACRCFYLKEHIKTVANAQAKGSSLM